MDTRRSRYLEVMGITRWLARSSPADDIDAVEAPPPDQTTGAQAATATLVPAPPVDAVGWDELRETVLACTSCPLHESRTQAVFGVGARIAEKAGIARVKSVRAWATCWAGLLRGENGRFRF